MSGYSYLDENVKRRIKQIVRSGLAEVSLEEPPVRYPLLYDNEKLESSFVGENGKTLTELRATLGDDRATPFRGLLFVEDKRVIVVDAGYEPRNNFVLAHEFGHWKVPWHQAVLYKCTQFDLSAKARKQMEREANYFASELSFMGDLFDRHLRDYNLTMENIKLLSDLFNMSREATLRRAVELELRPCALLCLTVNRNEEDNYLRIKYVVHSDSFERECGQIKYGQTFSRRHSFSKIITDPVHEMLNRFKCEVDFGSRRLRAEVWKNDYNTFVLCQPA